MRSNITFFRPFFKAAFLLLLASCYKNHLYVQQEWVDLSFLASSVAKTPDPQQEDPPHGQRLLIAWDFPRSLYEQGLTLRAQVRKADHSLAEILFPLDRRRGYTAQFFPSKKAGERAILTYRVDVLASDGEVLESWKHQFWTEWIEICP